MKRRIVNWLHKYPSVLNQLRAAYRLFDPLIDWDLEIQKEITKSFKEYDSVFFVQVGSNDGVHGDPLHALIMMSLEWKGMFIEPVGFLFNKLKHNYNCSERFIFERIAIASEINTLDFYYVSEKAKTELGDSLPFWYDQLGSFDKSHILKHLNGILEPYICSEKINTIPLQLLLEKHFVREVQILHIDAEGYDYRILRTLDFRRYTPKIILYEHRHLTKGERKKAKSFLKEKGYSCSVYGGDTLAIYNQ